MATTAAILDFRSKRFHLLLIYKSPLCFLSSFELTGLLVLKKKRKLDFQDGGHGRHLGFPIGMILTTCTSHLQVTLMLPIKFQVDWPFGPGEEAENRFSRWPPFKMATMAAILDFQSERF